MCTLQYFSDEITKHSVLFNQGESFMDRDGEPTSSDREEECGGLLTHTHTRTHPEQSNHLLWPLLGTNSLYVALRGLSLLCMSVKTLRIGPLVVKANCHPVTNNYVTT